MENNKTVLVNTIKDWLFTNGEISKLQKQLKEFKSKKKNLSDVLIKIMENNEIDRFDVKNGKLIYRKTKVKGTINKDYLSKMLDDYFKEYAEVDTLDVTNFILENRPVKESSSLVIKENK